MRVAVLGSGNGGCAAAFDFASHGHEVSLVDFEAFPEQVAAVAARGGIESDGDLSGFAAVAYAGHDLARALEEAELVVAVGPAFSTEAFGAACRPYLKAGQTVIVCPGSCGGALVFKRAAGLDIRDASVTVADTTTLPYAVRILEPGRIRVFLKVHAGGVALAAVPASETPRVLGMIEDTYPGLVAAESVLYTTFANANPVIHPAVTLCSAAQIERTKGDLLFYEEGVTESVARLMAAVDRERLALAGALGQSVVPDPEMGRRQGYMSEASYYPGYSTAPGFRGIKAQARLDHRYLNEDVGYGLVLYQALGRQLGVPTPVVDGLIAVASALMGRDYAAEAARTPEALGFAGLTADQIKELVT